MGKKRIDYIAKYAQRHRGPPPKRRTDFSNFLCSSSAFLCYSKSSPDSLLELSSSAKDGLVNSRKLSQDVGCDVSDKPPVEMEPAAAKCIPSKAASAMWKPAEVYGKDSEDSQSPDRENFSDQQLTPSDRWNSSNSSEAEADDVSSERGRGKRRRKPKIYLDEDSSIAVKSARKLRRVRIMRYLGLMAPIGSPF